MLYTSNLDYIVGLQILRVHFLISSVYINFLCRVICLCLISLANLSFGLIIKLIILICPYYQRCLYLVNVKVGLQSMHNIKLLGKSNKKDKQCHDM